MTRILNEDLRDRTSRASDTTKFLAREVQKLQADNDALDAKIAQVKLAQLKAAQDNIVAKPDPQTMHARSAEGQNSRKKAHSTRKNIRCCSH